MRSVSNPSDYSRRQDEEQTGVEIATKVLGKSNKTGQAPFYTGLWSPHEFLRFKKTLELIQNRR